MSRRTLDVAVLGLNYAPEPTGIAPYTTGLAEGLAARGHRVSVHTTFPHYPQWRYDEAPPAAAVEQRNGVAVYRRRHYVPSRPGTWNRAAFELLHGTSSTRSDWRRSDVVLMVSPALLAAGVNTLRKPRGAAGPATGLIIQDMYSQGVEELANGPSQVARMMRRVEGATARAADGVSVIHERFKSHVVSHLGVDEAKVRVIRNWTHVSEPPAFDVQDFRRSMGWGKDEVVVLHSGAMGAKQGLENVVRAAAFAAHTAAPVRFVLAGDGSQRQSLMASAEGNARIEFRDPLPDQQYARALRSADVLLVNEHEGLVETAVPSKLTSYFSAGRPVVAATSALSTTAHEIEKSGAGVRVAAGDPERLVSTVLRVSGDSLLGESLGRRGQVYARETLSRERAIDAYEDWVLELAAGRASQSRRQVTVPPQRQGPRRSISSLEAARDSSAPSWVAVPS